MRLRLFSFCTALFFAACSTPPKPEPEPPPPPPPPVEEVKPQVRKDTLKYLRNRNLQPQPTRALNVRSRCTHRDAIGTQTRLNLLVKDADVKNFEARIQIKGQGACQFALKEFTQDAKLPQVLLRHKREKGCTVRMWEQGKDVTIAFNSCPQVCEGKAFDYLWPVVVDAKTGRCH
ncbi:hypothetical protein [Azonexus sp.]|uniref:hypothetical protein n=1 Tax=Azonexus sp. TaxID=1872668 RepID=UPI0039E724C0